MSKFYKTYVLDNSLTFKLDEEETRLRVRERLTGYRQKLRISRKVKFYSKLLDLWLIIHDNNVPLNINLKYSQILIFGCKLPVVDDENSFSGLIP